MVGQSCFVGEVKALHLHVIPVQSPPVKQAGKQISEEGNHFRMTSEGPYFLTSLASWKAVNLHNCCKWAGPVAQRTTHWAQGYLEVPSAATAQSSCKVHAVTCFRPKLTFCLWAKKVLITSGNETAGEFFPYTTKAAESVRLQRVLEGSSLSLGFSQGLWSCLRGRAFPIFLFFP